VNEPIEGEVVGGGGGYEGGPGGPRRRGLDPARFKRMWLVPVVFGAAGTVLGALVLVWPGHTVSALTFLFGLYLLVHGVYRFVTAVQLKGVEPVARVVAIVLAVLAVAFGVLCVARPFHAASSLALVVGAFWLVSGALTVFGAWQRGRRAPGRSPGVTGGVFAMVIGLLIMAFPGASLVLLAWILGCWLIFFGVSAVATGLTARKLLARARNAPLYWP
jgi:uncharacterized membrane protein HdeD (DUF308 family)